jgi:hypothetical protein
MPGAILTTGLRCSSSLAQIRHCGLPSRKSSSGNSFPQAAHCRKPSIANRISSFRLAGRKRSGFGLAHPGCATFCHNRRVPGGLL